MDAFDFKSSPEKAFIRYVRVEPNADGLMHLRDRWIPGMVNHYPALEALDILTHALLLEWTWWIPEVYAAQSLRSLVWIISTATARHTMIDIINVIGNEPTRFTDKSEEDQMEAMRHNGHLLLVANFSERIVRMLTAKT
ncbi:hypothetical protein CDEST_03571 [Colletotrichum destructivum]|uniref:Uncharacterized protein n=1 Tax=Colletotrichum destructivum TaxID=34406 RepID=A0AAX4I603_9PEZI|nr:hypothetical protein CDEST_03571 [Colletotrichum destructivum]